MEILSLTSEAFAVDLSGHLAAASSIFLNCQGKREGYKKGRKSNRLSSGLYCSCAGVEQRAAPRNRGKMLLTAWYEGVRVVILCLFRAYSKKKCLTFSATYDVKQRSARGYSAGALKALRTCRGDRTEPHSCTSLVNMLHGPHFSTLRSRPKTESSSYVMPMSASSAWT